MTIEARALLRLLLLRLRGVVTAKGLRRCHGAPPLPLEPKIWLLLLLLLLSGHAKAGAALLLPCCPKSRRLLPLLLRKTALLPSRIALWPRQMHGIMGAAIVCAAQGQIPQVQNQGQICSRRV